MTRHPHYAPEPPRRWEELTEAIDELNAKELGLATRINLCKKLNVGDERLRQLIAEARKHAPIDTVQCGKLIYYERVQ